jgi:hypothetical protein
MKNITFILIINLCTFQCSAQDPSEINKLLLEPFNNNVIQKEELFPEFKAYDFSNLWTENSINTLGFIGNNYQRIKIKFLLIIKSDREPNIYYILGKSKVNNNICQFLGKIEIVSIREIINNEELTLLEEAKKQNDEEAIRRFSHQKFIILGKYVFNEDSKKNETGIFCGNFRSSFYLDGNSIVFDNLCNQSDTFSNNQFFGTWTCYKNHQVKKCNWGEFRIPYSGDLDIGVGVFSPNMKYINNGWESYYEANFKNDKNSQVEENHVWW